MDRCLIRLDQKHPTRLIIAIELAHPGELFQQRQDVVLQDAPGPRQRHELARAAAHPACHPCFVQMAQHEQGQPDQAAAYYERARALL